MSGREARAIVGMCRTRAGLSLDKSRIVGSLRRDEPQLSTGPESGPWSTYYLVLDVKHGAEGGDSILGRDDLGVAFMVVFPSYAPGAPGLGKVKLVFIPMPDDWFLVSFGRLTYLCDGLRGVGECLSRLGSVGPADILGQ
jgi:hypothetical protein